MGLTKILHQKKNNHKTSYPKKSSDHNDWSHLKLPVTKITYLISPPPLRPFHLPLGHEKYRSRGGLLHRFLLKREHLKYVWNVLCLLTKHMRELQTAETTWVSIGHGTIFGSRFAPIYK